MCCVSTTTNVRHTLISAFCSTSFKNYSKLEKKNNQVRCIEGNVFFFKLFLCLCVKFIKMYELRHRKGCYIQYIMREVMSEDVVIPPREWLEILHHPGCPCHQVPTKILAVRSCPVVCGQFVGVSSCLGSCVVDRWRSGLRSGYFLFVACEVMGKE